MAALATHTFKDDGTMAAPVAASTSDTVEVGNGRNVVVHYKNASASSVEITVGDPNVTDYGVDEPGNKVTVAAAAEAYIPMRKDYDDGTGRATITMVDATSVTVAVMKLG